MTLTEAGEFNSRQTYIIFMLPPCVCSALWSTLQQKAADYKQRSITLHIYHDSTRLNRAVGSSRELFS